jgi:hypothetical protein
MNLISIFVEYWKYHLLIGVIFGLYAVIVFKVSKWK